MAKWSFDPSNWIQVKKPEEEAKDADEIRNG